MELYPERNQKVKAFYYFCPDCNEAWQDYWTCACDMHCPKCDKYYTAFDSKREWIKAKTPNSIKFIKSLK